MKNAFARLSPAYLFTLLLLFTTGCTSLPQAEASAVYIAAETATAALIQKNPSLIPVVNLIASDWTAYQGGKLTTAQEATLLQTIVAATKGKLSPTEAAALDGATQQILANTNSTAPTPLGGAAAAIITTLVNGAERAAVIAVTPSS